MIRVPPPKKMKDYPKYLFKAKRELFNGLGSMPAGTVYRMRFEPTLNKSLHTAPCRHCGFVFKVTVKAPRAEFERTFDFYLEE